MSKNNLPSLLIPGHRGKPLPVHSGHSIHYTFWHKYKYIPDNCQCQLFILREIRVVHNRISPTIN